MLSREVNQYATAALQVMDRISDAMEIWEVICGEELVCVKRSVNFMVKLLRACVWMPWRK
jgi:hypothetical protein